MSDRLKLFRRLMSAFEGTSNPQRALERGYYVNLPNNPVGEITRRIELRPSSVHLLLGGIGSGKTTQLLLTQNALNELEDIKAIYVDVSLATDISHLQSGALIAIAGLELIKILGDIDEPELKSHKQIIERSAYGYSETKSFPSIAETIASMGLVPLNQRTKVVTHHKGLLAPKKLENRESIVQAFSTLNMATKQRTGKEIVFVFDGLDRLSNSQLFIDSALDDLMKIQNTGTGAILVGSIVTAYKERESIVGLLGYADFHYLPYLDIFESVEARQFFTDTLALRDPENFIDQDARISLMINSGGVLRDLMSLAQSAIEEAYVDGVEKITVQHANQAILSLARSKLMSLADTSINILHKVMTEEAFFPRTSEDLELLLTGHILEYRYPRLRFVVHPILVPIIEKMNLSVSNG